MDTAAWPLAEAKAKFSAVVDKAIKIGPQTVTKHGLAVVMVASSDEWGRKTRRTGNLATFFAESPLPGSGLDLSRVKDGPREIDL